MSDQVSLLACQPAFEAFETDGADNRQHDQQNDVNAVFLPHLFQVVVFNLFGNFADKRFLLVGIDFFFILSCSLYYCVKLIYLYRKTGSWQIKYLRTRQFLAVDHFVNQKLFDPAQILNWNLFTEDSGSVVGNNRKVIPAGCRVDGNFDRFDVCFFDFVVFAREEHEFVHDNDFVALDHDFVLAEQCDD